MSFFELFNPGEQHAREQRDLDKVRSLERKQSAPPNGSGMVDFNTNTLNIVVAEEVPEEVSEGVSEQVPDHDPPHKP